MHDPQKEELYFIKGDQPDPSGTGLRGTSMGMDMTRTAIAHPMIRYRDRVVEADVYAVQDELSVHILCPKCEQGLKISNKKKRVELSGDKLTTERIGCTWPGCDWRVTIKGNLAEDC